ncbi:uncharacterized protein LOC125859256 [Solanum stenotomum]|uniref:uncharacterized protein LOC125859256 n=1 Tax=Solanum stenotomum TaxID=172797 RepID=UPI0020D13D47|nr:uncharacterized protein LOC125859256 [Solanum stenotomum]
MASYQFESFHVRFTRKNYSAWEFQFQLFVIGKELLGHIDRSDPTPTDPTKLGQWKVKDARVMTWILGSIDPLIVLNLRPYKIAKAMWDYLLKVYNQDHSVRHFQLEHEFAMYSQGDLSVQDYFSRFQNLWAEFTDSVYTKIPSKSLSIIQGVHEQSKRDQFLMKLRSDFENVRSNLMNRDPSPSLEVCFRELLREEQRRFTQNAFHQGNVVTVAFAAQGKGKGMDMTRTQCYNCKKYGHIASNCGKKFCNYCKQQGHIIKECPTRPQNRRVNAFQVEIYGSTTDNSSSVGQVLTPEMVQQMILPAFSALGLQGNKDQVSGTIITKGPKVGRLFPIHFSIPRVLAFASTTTKNEVWHKRLGHPNSIVLSHLSNSGLLGNKNQFSVASFNCSTCKLGKSKTLSFPNFGSRAAKCFDVIHSDVWGISPVISHAHFKYFVTFIDDYSRFTWVYFLRSKSEVFSIFKKFLAYVETQFSTCIKLLRSDSGGEYMSHEFNNFLLEKGIVSQRSCPYTQQQNGVAECKNRHLLDVTRTLLIESSVPSKYWVEALSTVVY